MFLTARINTYNKMYSLLKVKFILLRKRKFIYSGSHLKEKSIKSEAIPTFLLTKLMLTAKNNSMQNSLNSRKPRKLHNF